MAGLGLDAATDLLERAMASQKGDFERPVGVALCNPLAFLVSGLTSVEDQIITDRLAELVRAGHIARELMKRAQVPGAGSTFFVLLPAPVPGREIAKLAHVRISFHS